MAIAMPTDTKRTHRTISGVCTGCCRNTKTLLRIIILLYAPQAPKSGSIFTSALWRNFISQVVLFSKKFLSGNQLGPYAERIFVFAYGTPVANFFH